MTSHLTHSQKVRIHAAEYQIPSQNSHKQTFICKLDENSKMELGLYLLPVSCVTSQVPGPGCVFGKLSETSDYVNFERKYLGK